MHKFEVRLAMEAVAQARKDWNSGKVKFDADVDYLMMRLLNEAAVQKMSASEVGEALGLTGTKVRALMRKHGLNPKTGRNLLAKQAAETLAENAALLGVEPHEFDLTSPLAYLPMGSSLREFLETDRKRGSVDAILDNDPDSLAEASRTLLDAIRANWHTRPGDDLNVLSPAMIAVDDALGHPEARNYPRDAEQALTEDAEHPAATGFWCFVCEVFEVLEDDGQDEVTTTWIDGVERCQGCGCDPASHTPVQITRRTIEGQPVNA